MNVNLNDYDLIVINSSGGKDSLVALWKMAVLIKKFNYPKERVIVSHQDLGESEWQGTFALAKQQAELFGFTFDHIKRIDKNGKEETLLEYALRRGRWPSNTQRWCTSDFKRGPGGKILRKWSKFFKAKKVLHVFGFRAEESPSRKKKEVFKLNEALSSKSREVYDYLPVHDWLVEKVWRVIRLFKLPYHWAYDLGMPRLSCVFCIFSPFDALVIAGMHNRALLDRYIEVEDIIEHTFRHGFSLHEVRKAIEDGYVPKKIDNWIM